MFYGLENYLDYKKSFARCLKNCRTFLCLCISDARYFGILFYGKAIKLFIQVELKKMKHDLSCQMFKLNVRQQFIICFMLYLKIYHFFDPCTVSDRRKVGEKKNKENGSQSSYRTSQELHAPVQRPRIEGTKEAIGKSVHGRVEPL